MGDSLYKDGYAEVSFERRMAIDRLWLDPSSPEVEQVRERVQATVARLAKFFGKRFVPQVQVPDRGLLREQLKRLQRDLLNDVKSKDYANINAAEQALIGAVPIEDDYQEKMVPLAPYLAAHGVKVKLSKELFHPACGAYASQARIFYVREEIAKRFANALRALSSLDDNYYAHIEDCYRKQDVQMGLLIRRVMAIARNHGDWEHDFVKKMACSLTASSPGNAGHQAGSAIDWRICDKGRKQKGEDPFLPLGNTYPEGGAVSSIKFPYLTVAQWETRMLFMHLMELAEFNILDTENWHVSHGDRGMCNRAASQVAIYGPFQDFDLDTGKITKKYSEEEIDEPYLSDEELAMIIDETRAKWMPDSGAAVSPSDFDKQFFSEIIKKLKEMRKGDRRREKQLEGWKVT